MQCIERAVVGADVEGAVLRDGCGRVDVLAEIVQPSRCPVFGEGVEVVVARSHIKGAARVDPDRGAPITKNTLSEPSVM